MNCIKVGGRTATHFILWSRQLVSYREGFTRPGPFLFDLLASIGLKTETLGMMLDLMDKAKTLLADEDAQQGSR